MSKREEFNKFYNDAAALGFQRSLAAALIPADDEVAPGQSVLAVARTRLAKADRWVGPHVRSLQNGDGRSARGPSATI